MTNLEKLIKILDKYRILDEDLAEIKKLWRVNESKAFQHGLDYGK